MKKLVVLTLVVAALSVQAYAMTATVGTDTPASWTFNGQNPVVTTARLPINSNDGNTPYVSEGAYNGAVGETFKIASACTLDKIGVVIAGSDTTTMAGLWDLGTGQNAWNQPASVDLVNLGNSLIGNQQFHFYGASGDRLAVLDMQGTEEVALQAGHKYLFVLTVISGGTMYAKRTGLPVDYPDVSLYKATASGATTMTTLRGDAARNWGLGVYIPEPATIALLALGLALFRKRS